ncbi:choice-of-anchor A family protein [Streptomyces sp. NPDC048641]|uniref:choice-of-anchor A family protein n=1 Tax=unclassified Streptomyces TaxID=2593676 RepID=UPI0034291810
MRISAAAAAAAVLGSSLTLMTPIASAAEAQCDNPLGIAGQFNEFIEGDASRTPDSEGAVAVGGDADFGKGFSVGSHLNGTGQLPGGNALVVGGTLRTGDAAYTVVEKGNVAYGQLSGRAVELKGGKAAQGGSPVDFSAEFGTLRGLSDRLAAATANGKASRTQSGGDSTLTLNGQDPKLNVINVTAEQLQSAKHLVLDVPGGSSAVVNVSGTSYDMNAGGTYAIDGPSGAGLNSKVLWNFKDATKVVKKSETLWPGTVLAPDAHVDLGTGGPLEGTVIAKSLTAVGSAETHYYPFTGCLPTSASVPDSEAPAPAPGNGTSSQPAPPSKTPSKPAASPTSQGDSGDDLAETGSGSSATPIALSAAAVLVVGGGLVFYAKRRRPGLQR